MPQMAWSWHIDTRAAREADYHMFLLDRCAHSEALCAPATIPNFPKKWDRQS